MVTGHRAFSGNTEAILHDAIEQQEQKPVHELAADVPPQLEEIVTRCLQKKPEERYQEMREVLDELRDLKEAGVPARKAENATVNVRLRAVATLIAIAIVAIGTTAMYSRMNRRPALASNDTLVLADMENKTGDKAFDQPLRFALGNALIQVPTLHLLSTNKILKSLAALGIPLKGTLSLDQARRVCIQTHSDAVISGIISDVGNSYRIELRATRCTTGELLAHSRADAAHREQVVHALGVAIHELRKRLGESTNSLKEFDQPLDVALSPSIEALNLWSEDIMHGGSPEAVPALKRAIELDPKFAIAHYLLAQNYFDVMQNRLGLEEFKAAYDLRQRADQSDRLQIEEGYFMATGQLESAISTLNKQTELYSVVLTANDLSLLYRYLGRYEDSRREAEKAVVEIPTVVFPYINLVGAYLGLGHLNEAQHVLEEAKGKGLKSRWLSHIGYQIAFVRHDDPVMQAEIDGAKGHAGSEDLMLSEQVETEAYRGHYRRARGLTRMAAASAAKGEGFMADFYIATQALMEAQVGCESNAIQMAKAALKRDAQPETKKMAALALALSGDTQSASDIAAELNRDAPLDTLTQHYHLPAIRAAVYLREHNPTKAMEELQQTLPYELGGTDPANLYPAYIRGLAYLQVGDPRRR